jgi:hypothetical protein
VRPADRLAATRLTMTIVALVVAYHPLMPFTLYSYDMFSGILVLAATHCEAEPVR